MITSMTGFGTQHLDNAELSVLVEIKTLNSKYLDINLRLPRSFSAEKELEIRNILKEKLVRGKVNLNLEYQQKTPNKEDNQINQALLKIYYQQLQEAAQDLGAGEQDIFRISAMMPNVMQNNLKPEDSLDEEWEVLKTCFLQALEKCIHFREDEGSALGKSFEKNIENIAALLIKVEEQDPKRAENIKRKLSERAQELAHDDRFDPNRFEQEMIYYLEKLDIAEEKVRLKKHLEYFKETLHKTTSHGKKLNFIAQEIGREINTIGSKANDALIQRFVVEMKEELDQIKEQVLNVL